MTETGAASGQMDVRRIMAMLPHRYPMLLVDRVLEIVPDHSIRAVKAVSMNEPFFQGHFPGRPIMPGVLIVEALAQAAGVLAIDALGLEGSGKLVYFRSEEHTSELQSLMRISYAVFCLKKKTNQTPHTNT